MTKRGLLIFTLGDPHSINVEALLRVIVPASQRRSILVIGSRWQIEHQAMRMKITLPHLHVVDSADQATNPGLFLLDPLPDVGAAPPEILTDEIRGRLTVAALQSVPHSLDRPMAVLTAPIDKYAANKAGFSYPGQTEFFEKLWQQSAVMLLAGPKLRVALATNHLAISDVSANVSSDMIFTKLKTLESGLRTLFGIAHPRIAVCGVNPHCGDQGLFGIEDDEVVRPAVQTAQNLLPKCQITGPVPADTIFYRAFQGEFDAVLAMYHDQGLGPLKTVHFDNAVNISLGLKHLRVSPDHGPARDLYGTGRASWASFAAALKLCEQYLDQNELAHGEAKV